MQLSVTWLLPVRNGMPFLPETLASIESQVYRNWKILAWDDGSTDGSVEELKRWIPARLPGKVVAAQSLGLGASLAEMVKLADTGLCARIDADDVNHPSRLEKQVVFMEQHPEVAVVGSQVIRLDASGHEHGQYHQLPLSHDDIVHRMMYSWVMWHPTVLFRREVVIEVGNYRNSQPVEDYDLWMRIAVKHKLANLDACLLKYRVHDGGISTIAAKQGLLEEAILKCFTRNAPALFGCSEQEAVRLRWGRNWLLLPLLLQIVHHLCRQQGGTVRRRIQTKSFREAVNALTSDKDVVTRLSLACCNPTVADKLSGVRMTLGKAFAALQRRVSAYQK
jgi:hypothetical protein